MSTPEEEPGQALQWKILFSDPDFIVPSPESVKESVTADNTIFNWGGVKIARLSPDIVVKFGPHVTSSEAKNMIFVKQYTETLPVPKIYACYSYGPINRDIEDYSSLFDTYIFMSFVEGQSLDKTWESYNKKIKLQIANQLKQYLCELRKIDIGDNYIGSADSGPVADPILENHPVRGPFDSEEAFNNTIIEAYQSKAPKRHIKTFLSGMLQSKHQIVFTHGDLRLQNIMVHNGSVSGILDWEFSGWYPEYWEFSKALYVWKWQNDWVDYLQQILQPYYAEFAVHSFLTETLW